MKIKLTESPKLVIVSVAGNGTIRRAEWQLEIVHAAASRLPAMGTGVTKTQSVRHSRARHPAVEAFLQKLCSEQFKAVRNA